MLLMLVSACFSQTRATLCDSINTWFNEVKISTKKAEKLWNKDVYGPILLVNPFTRQVFANCSDTGRVLKKEGKVYTGVLPSNVMLANASVDWGGTTWAMIMILPPRYIYEDKFDRINLLAHELFHVSQPSLKFPRQNDLNNNHLDQKDGRIYLRLELEALKKAVLTKKKSESMRHLKNAIIFRKYRYMMYPSADSTENRLDINEGITEYTGIMIANRNKTGTETRFISKIDEFLSNQTFVRTFSYVNIPVYGYFLNNSSKYWNKELTHKTNLTDYFIRKFNFNIPNDLKTAFDSIVKDYNITEITNQENSREENAKKQTALDKERFFGQPTLEIQFYKKRVSFVSSELRPLEDSGTVYPTMTANDIWGTLKVEKGGGLINTQKNTVIIPAPTKNSGNEWSGDGWIIHLNEGYSIIKNEGTENYKMIKL